MVMATQVKLKQKSVIASVNFPTNETIYKALVLLTCYGCSKEIKPAKSSRGVEIKQARLQDSAHLSLAVPELRARERALEMHALFVDSREVGFMMCECGEVLDFTSADDRAVAM
jgi:hypothetical protein